MSEIINTYPVDRPEQLVPIDRKKFYDDLVVSGSEKQPSSFVEVVQAFIFNERWELICQKRAKSKNHNPNMIDKTLWWHVVCGDSPHHTVMLETVQELLTPSIVLGNRIEFLKTYDAMRDYLTTVALLKYMGSDDVCIPNVYSEWIVSTGYRSHNYFGIYAGNMKNVDAEASGILFYSLQDLAQEMQHNPDLFTPFLHYDMEHYQERMEEFLKIIQ